MILNIIMWITMYPVLFIIYFVLKGEMKQKKDILFGVRLKEEWFKEEDVQLIGMKYKKQLRRWLLFFMICPIATFWISSISLNYTFWMMWLLLFIAVFYFLYIRANDRLKKWKDQKQLEMGEEAKAKTERVVVDLKTVGKVHEVKLMPFLPSLMISLMICLVVPARYYDSGMKMLFYVLIVSAVITLICYWAARVMDNMRLDVISLDSELNRQYGRAKRKAWRNYWLFMAWTNTLYTLVQAVSFVKQDWIGLCYIGGAAIYSLAILIGCIALVKRLNKIEKQFDSRPVIEHAWDDDRYWKLGMIYYNPKDKHAMVNKRVGLGTTMNMATAAGKVMGILGTACILIIPVSCIWVMALEFTPITLQVDSTYIYAKQIKLDYQLPIDQAEHIVLLDELPAMSKISGTGMDNLEKGTFYAKGQGNCQVFLNPQNHKFISFTIDNTQYYLSAAEDEQTIWLYEQIIKARSIH